MDILKDRHWIVGRKLSLFFGVWPTQVYKERIFKTCFICFMLSNLILSEVCQLVIVDFNLRSIMSVLQIFIPVLCTTSTYYLLVLQFFTYQQIFSWIVQDCQQLKDEIELSVMYKYVNESKLFATICGCSSYLFLCSFMCPAILRVVVASEVQNNKYQASIHTCLNHLFEKDIYYQPVIIYEILAGFVITTIGIIAYSLYFWFIQHACARFCIIKCKIHELFENYKYGSNTLEKPLDLSDWTVDIIQRLSKTREFMALVNKLTEKCYLFNMSLGFVLVILDFVCIPILMQRQETRNESFMFLFFIFDTLFIIYLNCFIGQRLMDYSIDVYEEMCLIPIHEISVKTQKLLLTTLMMNSRPCSISIGKIFVSSHEFFGDLLRMSFSFAMMLHSTGNI